MSEELATPAIKDKPVNPTIVGIVMSLIALLAPFAFFCPAMMDCIFL